MIIKEILIFVIDVKKFLLNIKRKIKRLNISVNIAKMNLLKFYQLVLQIQILLIFQNLKILKILLIESNMKVILM